jgi:23S rRNA pseudouridine2605 synthase
MPEDTPVRLQVRLAHAGLASRRAAEKIIAEGRVSVNGKVVTEQGEKVSEADIVRVDGNIILREEKLRYIALNKPPLYLCSSKDSENRPLAIDLVPPEIRERLYSVGRLDYRSSGLILFTNDGAFAAKITHPGSQIEKEYLAEASNLIPAHVAERFLDGVTVDGVHYKALEAEKTGPKTLRVVLIEGKNREIRRVFSHFHLHLERLRRIRIGPALLGALAEGKTRPLSETELIAFNSSDKTRHHYSLLTTHYSLPTTHYPCPSPPE